MYRRHFRLPIFAFATLLGCAWAWSTTAHTSDAAGVPTEAVWRIQEFDFYFSATRGRYHSCESLHSKIADIMETLGAGSVIVNIACDRSSLVSNTYARIATAMPMQATTENVRAATTFETEEELVARVRQIPLPTMETLERFPAEWREIAVTKVQGTRIGPEDCDLLHDLHEQVLPHLTSVRVVRKSFACGTSASMPLARPVLVVEALIRRDA